MELMHEILLFTFSLYGLLNTDQVQHVINNLAKSQLLLLVF